MPWPCRPTSHDDPIYKIDGIVHYCVTNMPVAVALTNQTLLFGLELANFGLDFGRPTEVTDLRPGVNLYRGHVTH